MEPVKDQNKPVASKRSKKIKILGVLWSYKILEDFNYDSKHGTDSAAYIEHDEHKPFIRFRASDFSLPTVRHELFHAYVFGLHLSSADLSVDQFEEVVAEMLGTHLPNMEIQAQEIYNSLLGKKEKNERRSKTRPGKGTGGSNPVGSDSGNIEGTGIRSEKV